MLVNGQNNVDSKNGKVNEFSENIELVEEILRRYHGDKSLKVTDIQCSPGSKDGDNYMSLIKRIIVKIKQGNNNSEYSTSLIIKRHILDKKRREVFRCDHAFVNEIAAYCHLVPVLKTFSHDSLPYPNCLFAGCDEAGEIIALEDLNQQGYKMTNRLQGLDFEHCSVVLKELASFHAMSLAMKIFDPMLFFDAVSKMHEPVFAEDATDYYSHVLDNTLTGALSSLNFSNTSGDLDKPLEILRQLSGEQLYGIMTDTIVNSSDNWKVICHGDLWINNLMFHYHNNKVKHVKFVDLQTIRYTNLITDLLMLIYTSTEAELRHKHLDRLIKVYRESLISNLREYLEKKYRRELATLEEEFSFENIKREFAARSLYGLGMSLWVMPAITFKSLSTDLDSYVESLIDQDTNEDIRHQPKEFHIRVRDIVKEFHDRGFLDNIFIDI